MDKKTGKYWYCPKCKRYPDNITTEEMSITQRKWDGDCYMGDDVEYDSENEKAYCQDCDTELEDKLYE